LIFLANHNQTTRQLQPGIGVVGIGVVGIGVVGIGVVKELVFDSSSCGYYNQSPLKK